MKVKWKKYSKKVPRKSGTYLITFNTNIDESEMFLEAADYYHAGEVIFYETENLKGDTLEERLLDWLENPDHEIKAERDGFYTVCDESAHIIKPVYWAKAPNPPKGTKWAK